MEVEQTGEGSPLGQLGHGSCGAMASGAASGWGIRRDPVPGNRQAPNSHPGVPEGPGRWHPGARSVDREAHRAWGPKIRNGPLPGGGGHWGPEEAVRAAGVERPTGSQSIEAWCPAQVRQVGGPKAGRRAGCRRRAGCGGGRSDVGKIGGPRRPSRRPHPGQGQGFGWGSGAGLGPCLRGSPAGL